MQLLAIIALVTVLATALTPPQSTQEYLNHLVGQRFILRHVAGSSDPKVKAKDLSDTKGSCDEAVEVTAIAFEKSAILLRLRNIGTPTVGNRNMSCAKSDAYSFKILDFDVDQPVDQAEKAVGYVLQTPETYLASLGVPWNLSPSSGNESPVDISRPGLTVPKVLLFVNPYYPAASRMDRIEGTVTISCILGTDGLVHDPVIVKGLSEELNKLALEAVTFYRIQPGRDGARAVAVKVALQFSFKLH
jgi:TonB family protein